MREPKPVADLPLPIHEDHRRHARPAAGISPGSNRPRLANQSREFRGV
jgi:hypothetical protein